MAGALFGGVYLYWRFAPNRRYKERVSDLKALRDLLMYHFDDLEDILAALKERYGGGHNGAAMLLLFAHFLRVQRKLDNNPT